MKKEEFINAVEAKHIEISNALNSNPKFVKLYNQMNEAQRESFRKVAISQAVLMLTKKN